MHRAFFSAELRRIDQDVVKELGIPSLLLMENAARGVCDRIQKTGIWRSVVILAGPGNNGGDGLAVARLLAARGIDARVYLIRNGKRLSDDSARNHIFLKNCGIAVTEPRLDDLVELIAQLSDQDLVVDSLLGTGTRGLIQSPYAEVVEAINASPARVLAVDIPTGFDSDTGVVRGSCVRADWTVTFVGLKHGFLLNSATPYTGEIWVSDIGVPQKWLSEWSQRIRSADEIDR